MIPGRESAKVQVAEDLYKRPAYVYGENGFGRLRLLESIRNVLENIADSQMLQCDVRGDIASVRGDVASLAREVRGLRRDLRDLRKAAKG